MRARIISSVASGPQGAYNPCHAQAFSKEPKCPMARKEFFQQVPLFAGLSEAELEALSQDFVQSQFRQGQTIFHQGDPGPMIYLIEAGQIRIYVQGEEGQETSVILYGPGDIFGELSVIDEMPRSASAVALVDTVVHALSRERFREHARRSSQLALNFMKALSVRVRYNTNQVGSLAMLDVPTRLARKLLELADLHGVAEAGGVRIKPGLTQSDLASLVGTTRESINKALGNFRRQGLISMKQGHILIVDADGLRELSS
jgi:CRP/FNR family cyclic AMP-dependent transcriptional regulator